MKYVVAFYAVDRAYGGPEEGGWWFDTGEFVRLHRVCLTEAAAARLAARANRLLDLVQRGQRRLDSVLYVGGRYCACVSNTRLRPASRKSHPVTNEAPMTKPDPPVCPPGERARTLAQFPLSRVTEAFHDEMLGVLPPAHIRGAVGFFVSEAVTADIHAQFVHRDGRFYGGYVALRDPATWVTSARIAAYDVGNPEAVELAWYPVGAGETAA